MQETSGEGNGYARLENAWQATLKDWDMAEYACVQSCRHPRTQAPMHARTQAPAYARRRPSTQPHTHTRKHIRTLAPMHALRHPHMLADDLASMHAHNTRAHKRARMRT